MQNELNAWTNRHKDVPFKKTKNIYVIHLSLQYNTKCLETNEVSNIYSFIKLAHTYRKGYLVEWTFTFAHEKKNVIITTCQHMPLRKIVFKCLKSKDTNYVINKRFVAPKRNSKVSYKPEQRNH
jgi:hypothetical protein